MRLFKRIAVFLVVLAFLLPACATMKMKPWGEMSTDEKALYFIQTYNQQFTDTMAMAINPKITVAQREIVRKKKEMLTELHGAIKFYMEFVDDGGVPSLEHEQSILNLINRLATAGS